MRCDEHENVGSCEQVLLNILNKQFAWPEWVIMHN